MSQVRLMVLCLLLIPSETSLGPIHTYEGATLASLLANEYGTLNSVVRDAYKHNIFL